MGFFKEIQGNLITLAEQGEFDVITHGCNCFCAMGAGIAPQMAKAFGADAAKLEFDKFKGDFNKLGQIDWVTDSIGERQLYVVNSYTQYGTKGIDNDIPLDYSALRLCFKKINHQFKGKHIGLPLIGCGLAGGDWTIVKKVMQQDLKDMDVTVVHFDDKYLK